MSTNIAAIAPVPGRPARLLLPTWIAAGALLVLATGLSTPVPAIDAHRPGMAYPGEMPALALLLAIDAALLLAVVRPWSYRHSWGRALVALVLWTPWAFAAIAAVAAKGGPASLAHATWLGLTWIALLGGTIVSAVAGRRWAPAAHHLTRPPAAR